MTTSSIPFPQLTSENFSTWKYRIKIILNKEGVEKTQEVIEALSATGEASFNEKDNKAQSAIIQSLPDKFV